MDSRWRASRRRRDDLVRLLDELLQPPLEVRRGEVLAPIPRGQLPDLLGRTVHGADRRAEHVVVATGVLVPELDQLARGQRDPVVLGARCARLGRVDA